MYNAPRAATVKAKSKCILWAVDRSTFNNIVKVAAQKKREQYENFLSKVKILQTMEPYERSKLSDAFQEHSFKAGDYIIKEGDEGNNFFIIEEGEAVATKTLEAGQDPKEVMQYKVGEYFGERALLKNEPRAANVIAKTDCKVVSMDRHSFKRLMGNLEDLLKRNMELYDDFKAKS